MQDTSAMPESQSRRPSDIRGALGGSARAGPLSAEDLRRAIHADELSLVFQPKVDMETSRVQGFEALLRWSHPVRGVIGPAAFIAIAEDCELIHSLTARVLDLALAQCARWNRLWDEAIPMAVNLSGPELTDSAVVAEIVEVLERHAVPPSQLWLEVTERTVAEDRARCRETLDTLRNLGARVAIDDFGSGYSSLAQLHHLPVDELKLDKGFLGQLSGDARACAIVAAAVTMADALGVGLVAEGVEDEHVARTLVGLGCQQGQGYHLGPPMAPATLEQWMAGPGRLTT